VKGAYEPYDILREASIALGVVLALTVVLTILFSSPDESPSTIKSWSHTDPVDFVTTATTELDGSSGTGGYGPPYNHTADGQHIAFIYPAKWLGVSHPINTAQDFVLAPLRSITGQPALRAAISTYQAAPAKTQTTWTSAYETALCTASAPNAPWQRHRRGGVRAADHGRAAANRGARARAAGTRALAGRAVTAIKGEKQQAQ
jgi:hypothetical protein